MSAILRKAMLDEITGLTAGLFYALHTPMDFTAAAGGVRPSLNPDPSRSEPPLAQ